MRRTCLLLAAAVLLTAPAAVAQDATYQDPDDVKVTGSRIVRQDFEAISPVTTVGSDELELTPSHLPLGWREARQTTANRARANRSMGASSVRVVRACEVNLALGDEDCAGN